MLWSCLEVSNGGPPVKHAKKYSFPLNFQMSVPGYDFAFSEEIAEVGSLKGHGQWWVNNSAPDLAQHVHL